MKKIAQNEPVKDSPQLLGSAPDISQAPTNPLPILGASPDKTIPVPESEKPVVKIVRIQPKLGGSSDSGNNAKTVDASQAKSVAVVAKTYEPLVGKIVELFNNTSVRVVRFVAKNSIEGYKEITGRDEEEKADAIAQHTSLDRTSRDLAATSLSRIAARKIENESSLDYIALATVGVDYLSGIATATAELSSTRNEIREALEFIRREKSRAIEASTNQNGRQQQVAHGPE